MEVRKIEVEDIASVLPIYIVYYNKQEDSCWTEITARKRIHQVLSMEDSYGLIMEDHGAIVGFA